MSADSDREGGASAPPKPQGDLDRVPLDPLGLIPSLASRRWERRIGRLGAVLLIGSVVSIALVPSLLSALTGPIVHLWLPVRYDQGACDIQISFYLINGGNRAGTVLVGQFADDTLVANWTFTVPAYTTVREVEHFFVTACSQRTYATEILRVEPA